MRNKYPGICYRCGREVKAGDGHFQKHGQKILVQHAYCAIQYRNQRRLLDEEMRRRMKDPNIKNP